MFELHDDGVKLRGAVVALPLALVVGDGCSGSSSGAPENCTISASNYDQSCNVDTDCQQVASGDYCSSTVCLCGNSTINVGAMAQFYEDVSKTPVGSGAIQSLICPCPAIIPCCRHGMCLGGCGFNDPLPACSDAGGTCSFGTTCGAGSAGPPDACVYSDEVCCLR
jgi:hypothetical protein